MASDLDTLIELSATYRWWIIWFHRLDKKFEPEFDEMRARISARLHEVASFIYGEPEYSKKLPERKEEQAALERTKAHLLKQKNELDGIPEGTNGIDILPRVDTEAKPYSLRHSIARLHAELHSKQTKAVMEKYRDYFPDEYLPNKGGDLDSGVLNRIFFCTYRLLTISEQELEQLFFHLDVKGAFAGDRYTLSESSFKNYIDYVSCRVNIERLLDEINVFEQEVAYLDNILDAIGELTESQLRFGDSVASLSPGDALLDSEMLKTPESSPRGSFNESPPPSHSPTTMDALRAHAKAVVESEKSDSPSNKSAATTAKASPEGSRRNSKDVAFSNCSTTNSLLTRFDGVEHAAHEPVPGIHEIPKTNPFKSQTQEMWEQQKHNLSGSQQLNLTTSRLN